MRKSVAIIPARGGSKRIPKKNIKDFFGKPIVAYSIQTALKSNLFKKVVVSTDDEQIAKVAQEYGAEVLKRPKELADDFTGTADVVKHALKVLEKSGEIYEYVCTIYATAPLLQNEYLIQGYEKLKNSNAVYAFSSTSMPFPIQRTFKIVDSRCQMFMPQYYNSRSQDLEEAYQDAGQFYWQKTGIVSNEIIFSKDSIPIILPRYLVQDIDTLEDWERAEKLYESIHKNIYDKWNKLKQHINKKEQKLYIKNTEIYFISIGQNIGYESYGKDELFLRPVLVYKKLSHTTFIGIPLTSKEKNGTYYFKFKYKNNKYSYASLNQLRVFDTKRVAYKSGNIKHDDFEELKKQMNSFIKVTPTKKSKGCITSKKKQRNKNTIIPQKDNYVK